MNIIVYIATSIDGYITDKNGKLDWLINIENPTGSDFGFFEFMESIDAIVMAQEITHRLDIDGHHNIYLDGGSTVQEFFAQSLVDELIITRAPIILGESKSLFTTLPESTSFKHIKTQVYLDTLVKTHYQKC